MFDCCDDGWKITVAGWRLLSKTEANYAPVEGEALAVAWALDHTKFFTMGCDNLLLIVDHKSLLKIFGGRRLDEIDNPRLFRLKWKTLRGRFDIEYRAGKLNSFADAVSIHPIQNAEIASLSMHWDDMEEASLCWHI